MWLYKLLDSVVLLYLIDCILVKKVFNSVLFFFIVLVSIVSVIGVVLKVEGL